MRVVDKNLWIRIMKAAELFRVRLKFRPGTPRDGRHIDNFGENLLILTAVESQSQVFSRL